MNKEIEKAIEFIKDLMSEKKDDIMYNDKIGRTILTALEAQQADMWIPISDRMPDNFSEVYVTTKSRETYHVFYSNNQFRFGNYSSDLICRSAIAWMPFYLPEPWKEEQ